MIRNDIEKHSPGARPARWWHAYLPPVWQNRDFRLLWISLTITHFGGQVTFLALPLTAALMLHATPLQMGILTAVEALPYTLFGLFTGVLIDRSRKLKLIILADIGRGAALLLVPVSAWFGFLSMPVLYLVGFLVGIGGIIGWAAYNVFMAERVGDKHLVDANAGIALSDSTSQLIGPGLAGAFIHWLTAPIAILVDALSFLFSAWILRTIPPKASDAPKVASDKVDWRAIWAESKQGLTMIMNHPVLKPLAFTLMGWNVLKHAYIAIVILYAAKDLDLSPGTIGSLFMMAGVGFLVATATVKKFNAHFGIGSIMLGGLTASALAWLLVSAVPKNAFTPVMLGASLFVLDLGVMLFFINYLSLRQAAVPEAFRGRVTSTLIFIAVSLAPLGSLAGGALAEWIGLRATIAACGAVGLILGLALFRFSNLPALRELPKPEADPATFPAVRPSPAGD